jgi:threonine synthase
VVQAWREGADTTAAWPNPTTSAPGLRVPSPFAGRQMLGVLRASGGEAIAVGDDAIHEAQRLLARLEGLWTAPEAAATVAALIEMTTRHAVSTDARVVLVLTGSGLKNPPPPLPPPLHLTGTEEEIAARIQEALAL